MVRVGRTVVTNGVPIVAALGRRATVHARYGAPRYRGAERICGLLEELALRVPVALALFVAEYAAAMVHDPWLSFVDQISTFAVSTSARHDCPSFPSFKRWTLHRVMRSSRKSRVQSLMLEAVMRGGYIWLASRYIPAAHRCADLSMKGFARTYQE